MAEGGRPGGPMLTVAQAAAYLSVSTKTIRRWIDNGTLPAYSLDGTRWVRVDLRDVKKMLKKIGPRYPRQPHTPPSGQPVLQQQQPQEGPEEAKPPGQT